LGAKKPVSVDVRVIAATHQNLEALIAEDKFRPDLYYRLNITRIYVPPLRERLDDLPKLVGHIVNQFNRKWERSIAGPTTEALELLRDHDWPGNVRELRNVLESAFWLSTSGQIEISDLPPFHRECSAVIPMTYKSQSPALPIRRTAFERDDLIRALKETAWNKSQTAELVRWSRMTVYRKIVEYGLTSESTPSAVTER
jgi:DNA-binding NtrC family response regulator